ncbi:MAG: hypothetical protein K2O54_03210, partial [Prevotella sp.]|nr:hypothetical protein [Prevotella sp.]
MSNLDLYSQFDTAYKNARLSAKQNNALSARSQLIACMSLMLEIYKNTEDEKRQAKLYEHICEFRRVSTIIYESGITADVKTWFGIAEEKRRDSSEDKPRKSKIDIEDYVDWAAEVFARCSDSVATISAKTGKHGSNGTG